MSKRETDDEFTISAGRKFHDLTIWLQKKFLVVLHLILPVLSFKLWPSVLEYVEDRKEREAMQLSSPLLNLKQSDRSDQAIQLDSQLSLCFLNVLLGKLLLVEQCCQSIANCTDYYNCSSFSWCHFGYLLNTSFCYYFTWSLHSDNSCFIKILYCLRKKCMSNNLFITSRSLL